MIEYAPEDLAGQALGILTDDDIKTKSKDPDASMVMLAAAQWAGAQLAYGFTRSKAVKRRLSAMTAVALNIARSWQELHGRYVQALSDLHALQAENKTLPNGAKVVFWRWKYKQQDVAKWVLAWNGGVQPWVVWSCDTDGNCDSGQYFDKIGAAATYFDNCG